MLLWLGFGLVATVGFALVVAQLNGGGHLVALSGAVLWWALVSAVMVGGAALLNQPDGTRVDRFGIPNGLTAIRAWTCLPLYLCAAWPLPRQLGFVLWCVIGGSVGMLDFVDGYIARRFGPVTVLGKAIDPAGDSLFFSVGAVGSVLVGILPWWLAALILVRYLGPLALTPLVFLTRRRPELVHTTWGRRNTAATGVVFFICMWVRIFNGPVSLAAAVIGLPLLVPTMLLHGRALIERVAQAPVVR